MIQNAITMKKKLQYILGRKYINQLIINFIAIIFGSLFELLGVSAFIPFLQVILDAESMLNHNYIGPILKILNITSNIGIIYFFGIGIMLVYVVKNAFLILSSYLQAHFATMIQRDLSDKMLISYISRPYTFFINANSASILRGINEDIDEVYNIISNLMIIFSEILSSLLIVIFLIYTDPLMTLGIGIVSFLCFIFIIVFIKKRANKAGLDYRNAMYQRNKNAYQMIHGIKDIVVMNRQLGSINRYKTYSEEKRRTLLIFKLIHATPTRIIEGVCVSGILLFMCIRISMGVNIIEFLPKLGVFAMAAFKILPTISKISQSVSYIIFHRKTVDTVYNNFKEAENYYFEEAEKSSLVMEGEQEVKAGEVYLKINDISWTYENTTKKILDGLSLSIKKGESVAFIGDSGSGKTTLADIILGLLKPQEGNIFINNIDVYANPHYLGKNVGYVSQNVFLCDDSIRNNIALGIEQKDIDDERVWKALEKSQLKNFIEKTEKQLDTVVGERGIKLSGGQRQRISIARALYHEPELIVLDEATSALDYETERNVMEAIELLQGKKTLIIIAHRLSTVEKCDMIYEIKNGKAFKKNKEELFCKQLESSNK